jgi:hypothetical protein
VRLLTQGSAGGELPKTQEPLERHVACAWATRNVASHIWGGSWEAPVAEQQPGPSSKRLGSLYRSGHSPDWLKLRIRPGLPT